MNRDPFRQTIIDRLNGPPDGDTFEKCVNDLLRPEWPTLIPVPGGDDAGVDGAWANEHGRGILIATTQADVIGNVTRNLKENIAKGGTAKQVLVATSRPITARQCRNIEKRIRELGFVPAHHPYTQQAIADRLYHNSQWLRELLGLTGGTSALSKIPRSNRPLRDIPLIGRDEDMMWLRETSGDRLLIGQPGIGKTFLCQALVDEELALFATHDDIDRLAEAIRDQQPTAIVVEDAHLKLDVLTALIHYRQESNAKFAVIADCWPGSVETVANVLTIPKKQCRELQPLAPNKIVELIKAAGIHGPNPLLHQLVRQSMGCPGRAALLAYLCLVNGEIREVYEGRAFAKWAYSTFSKLVGERSLLILAGFAIGGDAGMSPSIVSAVLGYPLADVIQDLTKLALGGVVYELSADSYCVLPEPFRSALVADFFFERSARLPYMAFLSTVPRPAGVVDALIGAYARGASIPLTELMELVEQVDDGHIWERFLWTDESAGRIACSRHPELILAFPKPLLHHAPDLALPDLLDASLGDDRALHSHPDHPLQLIQDWIESANLQIQKASNGVASYGKS